MTKNVKAPLDWPSKGHSMPVRKRRCDYSTNACHRSHAFIWDTSAYMGIWHLVHTRYLIQLVKEGGKEGEERERKEEREGGREREKEKSREGSGKRRRLAVLDLWIIDHTQ